ncbi:MAG TPA: ribonuclease P protein component [Firmicutes bacterium]|mgnify:FL=1|nr:ribonuclease P protein component [Bacillota bacterium]
MEFTQSIKKNTQFGYVYNKGKSMANRLLVLYAVKNKKALEENRLGITVSKKVGKSVVRSRVTRLIKESYRLNESRIRPGYWLVVIARVQAKDASYHEMEKALCHLLRKQGLLREEKKTVQAAKGEEG